MMFLSKDAISHITGYFSTLYTKEDWLRPSLDNLAFESIGEADASWLEREFKEERVMEAVFKMNWVKLRGRMGSRPSFFTDSG